MNITINPIGPETEIQPEQTIGILHLATELIERAMFAIRPCDIAPRDFQILNDHTHEIEQLAAHMAYCTGTRPLAEMSRHGPDDVEAVQTTLKFSSDFGSATALTCTRGALRLLTSIAGNGWASDNLLACRGETERRASLAVVDLEAATAKLANLLLRRRPRPV